MAHANFNGALCGCVRPSKLLHTRRGMWYAKPQRRRWFGECKTQEGDNREPEIQCRYAHTSVEDLSAGVRGQGHPDGLE